MSTCNLEDEIKEIQIDKNVLEITPNKHESPYGNFEKNVGKLTFHSWALRQEQAQVLKFISYSGNKLLLKREMIMCNSSETEILKNEEYKLFIQRAYKKYKSSKLSSAHPLGINVHGFYATRLNLLGMLVIEILIDDVGIQLKDKISLLGNNIPKVINLLKDSTSILSFHECHSIENGNLSLDNFLLDENSRLRIHNVFKLNEQELLQEMVLYNLPSVPYYSNGFASPEIINYYQNLNKDSKEIKFINSFKSDVYSWGIFALYLLNAFEPNFEIEELDLNKLDENNNSVIIAYFENLNFDNLILKEKIQMIINCCLNFFPEKRISFYELNSFLDKVTNNLILPKYFLEDLISVMNNQKSNKIKGNQGESDFKEISKIEEENLYIEKYKEISGQIFEIEVKPLKKELDEKSKKIEDLENMISKTQYELVSAEKEKIFLEETNVGLKEEIKRLNEIIKTFSKRQPYLDLQLSKSIENNILIENLKIDKIKFNTIKENLEIELEGARSQIFKNKHEIEDLQSLNLIYCENLNDFKEKNNYLRKIIENSKKKISKFRHEINMNENFETIVDSLLETINKEISHLKGEAENQKNMLDNLNQEFKKSISKTSFNSENSTFYDSPKIIEELSIREKQMLSKSLIIKNTLYTDKINELNIKSPILSNLKKNTLKLSPEIASVNIFDLIYIYDKLKNYLTLKAFIRRPVEEILNNNEKWDFAAKYLTSTEIISIILLIPFSISLKYLNLQQNEKISNELYELLISSIQENNSMELINLGKNQLSLNIKQRFIETLSIKNNLKFLLIDMQPSELNNIDGVCKKFNLELNNWNSCPLLGSQEEKNRYVLFSKANSHNPEKNSKASKIDALPNCNIF